MRFFKWCVVAVVGVVVGCLSHNQYRLYAAERDGFNDAANDRPMTSPYFGDYDLRHRHSAYIKGYTAGLWQKVGESAKGPDGFGDCWIIGNQRAGVKK